MGQYIPALLAYTNPQRTTISRGNHELRVGDPGGTQTSLATATLKKIIIIINKNKNKKQKTKKTNKKKQTKKKQTNKQTNKNEHYED